MFKINPTTKEIKITRGDIGTINLSINGYTFKTGDILRFKVIKFQDCKCIELQKDIIINEETSTIEIHLTSEETRIGDLINKPVKYWYEVELNPETNCQTIIGYDDEGEKIFRLYPEGGNK
jgi:hypothetical protein